VGVFQAAVPPQFFEDLRRTTHQRKEGGVFTTALVTWLMMTQRLSPKSTLSNAVQEVLEGRPGVLLPSHKRLAQKTLCSNTGAYSNARQRLNLETADKVANRIFQYLMVDRPEALPGTGLQAFLLDGSSQDMAATDELTKAFPPAQNQHGSTHFPVLRIVVAHDLVSGIATRPQWGPMYGKEAVSEQGLSILVIDQLPKGSVVVGDRNFGVFSVACHAVEKQHPVVLRLTDSRARSLLQGKLPQEVNREVDWVPSRWDRDKHPDLSKEAHVRGRLIACRVWNQGKPIQLYLFTTLDLTIAQIVKLYGYRWYIETDLRSLKRTVHLHRLTCASVDMVAKELVLGVAAYNLVRSTMYAAGRAAGIDPRQLSFSHVQDVINAMLPSLAAATSPEEQRRVEERILKRAAQCRLPKRRSPRPSYPRAVWGHHNDFPKRKEVKKAA
jgi:putative transposase